MCERASVDAVAEVLTKLVPEARLQRIPRNPAHREILLAVLCLHMDRRYPYTEREMNDYLVRALGKLNAEVDHVTCRRYLADLDFVKRDLAGSRYYLNFPKVESVLSDEAMAAADRLITHALAARRRRRPPKPRSVP